MNPAQFLPVTALLFASLIASPAYAQDAGNAGVSGEADFNMYCATCHGENGKGNGPKAFGLSKPLPDLSDLTERYGNFPRERLAKLIDGREVLEGHGDREMPVWGVWFKEEAAAELGGAEGDEGSVARRVENLIGYVETLQAAP
jgi:mono/diheme cytochrome c family protein